jgi:hypothetical protein
LRWDPANRLIALLRIPFDNHGPIRQVFRFHTTLNP